MRNKTINTVFFMGIMTLFSSSAFAQNDFRTEIGLGKATLDYSDNSEIVANAMIVNFYLTPVKTADHPLAEAAFLEHAASIGIYYGQSDESLSSGIGTILVDGDTIGAEIDFRQKNSRLTTRASLIKYSSDIYFPVSGYSNADIFSLEFGAYVDDNLHIKFEYTDTSSTSDTFVTDDTTTYEISAKQVTDLYNGNALNLEGGVIITKSIDTIRTNMETFLIGDYYFNRYTSFGAGYGVNSGEDASSEGETLAIRINHFFSSAFSVQIIKAKINAENSGVSDEDLLSIQLLARF